MIKILIALAVLLCSLGFINAQNIAITDDDAYTANTSAMLDVKSLTKGLLIPRLTTAQRTAIVTPATGLLVFDTTINGFYYYNGSSWINLTSGSTSGVFWSYTSPNIFMTTATNKLGLGISAPLHKLHLYESVATTDGTDGNYIDIQNASSSVGAQSGIRFMNGTAVNTFKGAIFYRDSLTNGRGSLIFANNTTNTATNVTDNDARLVLQSDGRVMVKGDPNQGINAAIFAVQNSDGDTVFAVYPEGVRVWVNDAGGSKAAGSRGGFAVGGYSPAKAGFTNEYLRVTPDSVRIYIDDEFVASKAAGNRGGFAVGGFDPAKGTATDHYLFVQDDSTRVFVNDSTSGFGVENIEGGSESRIMRLTTENYLIGHQSGIALTGKYNSFYGYKTAPAATGAYRNVLIGYETGMSLSTGDYNVFIGTQAGNKNNTGSENNFIGYQAGYNNIGAIRNIFMGYQAGYSNTSGTRNTFVGSSSGFSNVDGSYNSVYGHYSANLATLGDYNVLLGYYAGYNADNISNCVFIGSNSGYNASGSSNSIAIGSSSGYVNTAANNLFIGTESGRYNSSGTKNVFMGYRAGYQNTTGEKNIAIGNNAGYSNTTQSQTICIGDSAGSANTAPLNIFIGPNAGVRNSTGLSNLFIGNAAGAANTTSGCNTYIGWYSGGANIGEGNTFIGPFSGFGTSNGSRNVFLGMFAGNGSNGSDNVFIGYNAATGGSNQLAINNDAGTPLIFGDFTNKRAGIYTETPSANFHIKQFGTGEEGLAIEDNSSTNTWSWEIGTTYLYLYYNGTQVGYWNDATGAYVATSDKKMKKDIEFVNESILSKVMKLQMVNYRLLHADQSTQKTIGFLAQDVELIFPELVQKTEEGVLGLNYDDFGIIAIKAIQEQQNEIDNLKKEIELLKQMINSNNSNK